MFSVYLFMLCSETSLTASVGMHLEAYFFLGQDLQHPGVHLTTGFSPGILGIGVSVYVM
jgi:hypothetical protein